MPLALSATRIGRLFGERASSRKKAFIVYLTAGDPHPSVTADLILAAERGGADLMELGVPFSDPIADGPVIQRAAERALAAGTSVHQCLEIVRAVRTRSQVPILFFSYLNPLLRYGFDRLARDAAGAGVDGVLLTDLSVEESSDAVTKLRAHGLDVVFLAAPTSTDRRLELVARQSSGFVYLVSRLGVTGEQKQLAGDAVALTTRMRQLTSMPLALGFGISTPAQVKEAASLVDGVVVGSAIVKLIESQSANPDLPSLLERFVRELSEPLRT